MVATVLLLDACETIIGAIGIQHFILGNWGVMGPIPAIEPWGLTGSFIFATIIVTIVQLFFAEQIFRFDRKSWPWCVAIALCSTTALVLSLVWAAYTYTPIFTIPPVVLKYFATVPPVLNAIADVLSASLLTILLKLTKLPIRTRRITRIIKRIIVFSMTRAVLVSAVQIIFVITLTVIPQVPIWVPFRFVVSKMYVNTLLAMLNSRAFMREDSGTTISLNPIPLTEIQFGSSGTTSNTAVERSRQSA